MQRTSNQPIDILLVEDNQDDVLLTRQCFKQSGLKVNLHHVSNGQQCMEYLRHQGDYAASTAPDLILLDLNMPVMTGEEVLAELTDDDALKHLPVVVLTTSSDQSDVLSTYRLECSAYVVKPVDLNEFLSAIQSITNFWFNIAARPHVN